MNTSDSVRMIIEEATTKIRLVTGINTANVFLKGVKNNEDFNKEALELVQKCCARLSCTLEELKQKTRKREVVQVRQIIALFLHKKYVGLISYKTIAVMIGYGDHSDFIHGKNTAKDLLTVGDDTMVFLNNQIEDLL
jgi:chromosomal replication initiation ATPase DnaA